MIRTATGLRRGAALAALLLAGTATGAHAQFSGDSGAGSGDAYPGGGHGSPLVVEKAKL